MLVTSHAFAILLLLSSPKFDAHFTILWNVEGWLDVGTVVRSAKLYWVVQKSGTPNFNFVITSILTIFSLLERAIYDA